MAELLTAEQCADRAASMRGEVAREALEEGNIQSWTSAHGVAAQYEIAAQLARFANYFARIADALESRWGQP